MARRHTDPDQARLMSTVAPQADPVRHGRAPAVGACPGPGAGGPAGLRYWPVQLLVVWTRLASRKLTRMRVALWPSTRRLRTPSTAVWTRSAGLPLSVSGVERMVSGMAAPVTSTPAPGGMAEGCTTKLALLAGRFSLNMGTVSVRDSKAL